MRLTILHLLSTTSTCFLLFQEKWLVGHLFVSYTYFPFARQLVYNFLNNRIFKTPFYHTKITFSTVQISSDQLGAVGELYNKPFCVIQ